jgi:photosystem II stability/assembly factor-like uncharacterized protein
MIRTVLWLGVVLSALPCNAGAQALPDLVVEALSVHATMPDANGERQITTSVRIVNRGPAAAGASLTRVQSAPGTKTFVTPALVRGATAFLATTLTTSAADFTMTVEADVEKQVHESSENNNFGSYRFLASEAAIGRWRPLGPSKIVDGNGRPVGVGRITTIAADPSSPDTIFASSRGTGLWKTTDGGAHWEPLTDALPTVNINAVAVDPTNSARVFIASPAGIFGSIDGGHVWRLLNGQNLMPQGIDGGAFIVHPLDPQRLYLTTRNGLRISRNGGATWIAPVLGAGGIVESLVPSRSNPNSLLATVVESPAAGVYETIDGGLAPTSWRKLQGCPEGPIPIIPATKAGAWVARSGVTQWISIKNGTQHELWRTSSRACVVNGRFERVWQRLSSGDQTPCIGSTSAWSFLFADPTNNQILYKGGINLCRSTDGGANFVRVPGVHVDQHALVFHPSAPGLLFLGNDGGLFRSDNGGQSWTFNAEGMHVTEFLDMDIGVSPYSVVGGSQDNSLSSTDQTGPAWRAIDLGSDPDGDRTTVAVDPLDPTAQYSIGQAVDHFSRTKDGHREEGFDTAGMPEGCLTYEEGGPTLFTQFIATDSPEWHLLTTVGSQCGGGLWTGPPWRPLLAPLDGETLTRVTHESVSGLFLAGGNRGSVYINFSPNFMAKVWSAPAPAGSVTAVVRDFGRTSGYFVALSTSTNAGAGRIFEISPAGVLHFDGRDITVNLPTTLIMTLASNRFEPDVLYAGTQGKGVFRGVRDTAGQWRWQAFNNGMPQGAIVTKLRTNTAFGTIYAATFGRGVFALDTVSIF